MAARLPILHLRWRLWAAGLAGLAAGCGGGTGPSMAGSVVVRVSVTGPGVDPDGFQILLDAQQRRVVAGAGEFVIGEVPPGRHTIELAGVAATCAVTPANPQTAEITPGASTAVGFIVTCARPTGSLRIVTHTTGALPDTDGYQIRLDGGASRNIGVEDTLELSGLEAGGHQLQLTGLASNCAVADLADRTVRILSDATTTVRFDVACPEPLAEVTSIIVSVASVLINAPQNLSYTVVLDQSLTLSVPATGRVTFQTVPGPHSVLLRVPSYCGVGGFTPQPNPVSVTLAPGETRTVQFSVLCIG